jgi:cell division protein FtsB
MKVEKRFSVRQAIVPLLSVIMVGYFTYHIFQGERGIIAYVRLQQKFVVDENERNALQLSREQLEKRVYLLRPHSLDTDLLEERARAVLNFAHPNEVIIYDGSIGKPKTKMTTKKEAPKEKR